MSRLLLDHGLLDRLVIWRHPILSGKATPSDLLYRDGEQRRLAPLSPPPCAGAGGERRAL